MAAWAAALSYHFMMHLAYLRTEKRLRKLMKWLHLIAWGPFAVSIIVALAMGTFGPAGYWCWVVSEAVYMRSFVFAFIWICVGFSLLFTTVMIIRINFIWPTLDRLYAYATGEQSSLLSVLHALFGPLWGFLNLCAHLAPKVYMRKVSFWEGFSYNENQQQRERLAESKNNLFASNTDNLEEQSQQPEGYVYINDDDGNGRFVSIAQLAMAARRRDTRPAISFTKSSVDDLSEHNNHCAPPQLAKLDDGRGPLSPQLSYNDSLGEDGEASVNSIRTIVDKARLKFGLALNADDRRRVSSRKGSSFALENSSGSSRRIRDISAFLGEHRLSDSGDENDPERTNIQLSGETLGSLLNMSIYTERTASISGPGHSANSLCLDVESGPESIQYDTDNAQNGTEMVDLDTMLNNIEVLGNQKRRSVLGVTGRTRSYTPSPMVTPEGGLSPGSNLNSPRISAMVERRSGQIMRNGERPRSASGWLRDAWVKRNNSLEVSDAETRPHTDINRVVSAPFALTKKFMRSLSDDKSDDQAERESPKISPSSGQLKRKGNSEGDVVVAEKKCTKTSSKSGQLKRKGKGESQSESSATPSHAHTHIDTNKESQSIPLSNTKSFPAHNTSTLTFSDTYTGARNTLTSSGESTRIAGRSSPKSSRSDLLRSKISKKLDKGKKPKNNSECEDVESHDNYSHSSGASPEMNTRRQSQTKSKQGCGTPAEVRAQSCGTIALDEDRDDDAAQYRGSARYTHNAVVREYEVLGDKHGGVKHTQSMVKRGDSNGSGSKHKIYGRRRTTSEKKYTHVKYGGDDVKFGGDDGSRGKHSESETTDRMRGVGASGLDRGNSEQHAYLSRRRYTDTNRDLHANTGTESYAPTRTNRRSRTSSRETPNITVSSESRDTVSISSAHAICETTPNTGTHIEEHIEDDTDEHGD
ncbi:hypothetical protein SARC_11360 [Sphaeroforma arctica JP610]|uniref:G-protein coupled receptors family 2 profile 2 domain-containing protein n=1 Tax=Sphaeroforma arctica JP610 TaxID=667725 RepID=A0A0L0FHB2_9EUKA|nr:hypothetical protein SARC_11360 [Sphaeroforma arctica JP610]KNC76130.1 hypothetical protein SARC_11360 [Sphaeroforma arctica JP610]|eukprot:XP_014150032.1 hypothetical protein SARC_11360 [Sphaeroforma arctica JP610]